MHRNLLETAPTSQACLPKEVDTVRATTDKSARVQAQCRNSESNRAISLL